MSEYQRYEFMTVDRPLTRTQLDAVNDLSSHIEASSTHAIVEYHWGDFKHDPIKVLHKYFDGFLYWANWGSPRLAFRFPHGILPVDLIAHYDFDDWVTFTQKTDYDILDIHFGELEAPDMWTEYDLGSLIAIREELMEGDLRALYIAWLAAQKTLGRQTGYRRKPVSNEDYDEYDDDEDYEDEDYEEDEEEEGEEEEKVDNGSEEKEDYAISIMPVPSGFAMLTAAQQMLAELLQVPQELLIVTGQHSSAAASTPKDDFAAWIESLSQARRTDYLVRLARNEPGLSRLLVKELRELNPNRTKAPTDEQVAYATLLAESKAMKTRLEQERREKERLERERRLQAVHEHQDDYWQRVEQGAQRKNASGYDEAVQLLVDLRDAADQFQETQTFQARFRAWVQSHLRRPALLQRLQRHMFSVPQN